MLGRKRADRARTDTQVRVYIEEEAGDNEPQDGVTQVLESAPLSLRVARSGASDTHFSLSGLGSSG